MVTASTFVLVHSPLVGPKTWAGVAVQLADRDRVAVVPSMLGFADDGPPYWPSFVERLVRSCERIDGPLTLVAHSGAGLLLPVAVGRLGGRVESLVFADAALAPLSGSVEPGPPWLCDQLRTLAVDGLLPPWSDWWGPDAMATLLPDERVRADLTSELPRLPLDYFEQTVDVPDGWSSGLTCVYLRFSEGYDVEAAEAEARGWRVEHLPGSHLLAVTSPADVAEELLSITR
jgi:hypothetical protein